MKYQAFIVVSFILSFTSCDIYKPQRKYRIATPEKDYFYNYIVSHLKPFLESHGYEIEIVKAPSSIEAANMVAAKTADLTLINNHSIPIINVLSESRGKLRTVLPITTRLFFAFSKEPLADTATAKALFENKKVGIEVLGGEAQLNLEVLFSKARINQGRMVTFDDDPEVIVFWGTFYGERAKRFLKEGWHPFSFKQNWIEFLTLNEPAFTPYLLPAVPGENKSVRINTLATETLLVTHEDIGENAIYTLANIIYQNKLELSHQDIMYRSIRENFDPDALLFPLHQGSTAFLRRDQPTFWERYADTIALIFSIVAVFYGGIQTVRNNIAKRKKDQVDKYFLDFLEIRQNKEVKLELKVKQLDDLFQRAVEQMTNEKLEKSDFHILSRLIQQELTIIRFNH